MRDWMAPKKWNKNFMKREKVHEKKNNKEILATAQKNTHTKTKQIGIVRMVS